MPRSKRNKEVTLSKVKKAPNKEKKDDLILKIQDAVEANVFGYVVAVENQRNDFLKQVRKDLAAKATIFMGKNNVMKLALGTNASNEVADKIHLLSEQITGTCALLYIPFCIGCFSSLFPNSTFP